MTRIVRQSYTTPSATEAGSVLSLLHAPSQTTEVISNNDPATDTSSNLTANIYDLPSDKALYFSCQPPRKPGKSLRHVPCDIVLVIDVSSSMNTDAPLPDLQNGAKEDTYLSILDLVKHSARTILENLNERDRLAIVTFSTDAELVQELMPMSDHNKKETNGRIENLQASGITNLWAGIRSGLWLFENTEFSNVVQGLFVLTDGLPNHMCPKQGYVNKMDPMLTAMGKNRASMGVAMPSIHTFGFGYNIRSELMQSIAEIGNGNYAFIPDAGMIGTVFVHAVANLFSTFAVNAVLELTAPPELASQLRCSTVFNTQRQSKTKTVFNLGNLQYGQSRDIILKYDDDGLPASGSVPPIKAILSYKDHSGRASTIQLDIQPWILGPCLTEASYAYHHLRSQLCEHLSSFFPILPSTNEHATVGVNQQGSDQFNRAVESLKQFICTVSSHPLASDPHIASIINDLMAPEGEQNGQVSKAIQTNVTVTLGPGRNSGSRATKQNYYQKWGQHYLPSLLHAHARQVCNSFKDPGPLMYGQNSPLFIQCRDELDAAFENLPAPKPSLRQSLCSVGSPKKAAPPRPIRMSRYHSRSNPCFSGRSEVLLADDSLLAIEQLVPGHQVWTQAGARKVVAVLRTEPLPFPDLSSQYAMDEVDRADRGRGRGVLCKLGGLWVTPWHPVLVNGRWRFPAQIAEGVKMCNEPVYSLLLEEQSLQEEQLVVAADSQHTVKVGGVVAVTLGHGIIPGAAASRRGGDIRAHAFFGHWTRVKDALDGLQTDDKGRVRCGGVLRDKKTDLVYGFQPVTVVADVGHGLLTDSIIGGSLQL